MLYLVATPIGNLKDITLRALEVLKEVDEIACEDTRHSLILLKTYNINKPLMAYHKFNEKEASEKLIDKLKQGKNIALITDAGMPIISDPGNVLVKMLIENGLEYTVIPGASAGISALALSGTDSSRFCFLGFLPSKHTERTEFLNTYKNVCATLIFYSAPHDICKDVKDMYAVFGNRKAVAVKEITKIHEKVESFTLEQGYPFTPKGEYVLIVEQGYKENENADLSDKELIYKYVSQGMDKKDALKKVSKERGIPKSVLYKYTISSSD